MSVSSPVFLVAPVRSGSTLFRLVLKSHPNIASPGECDFLFDSVSDEGDFPSTTCYAASLKNNRIYEAKDLLFDGSLNFPAVMDSFMNQLCQDAEVLVISVHRNFHRIPFVFPNARYIHLLRDPRDVARSCVGMGWVGHAYFGADICKEAEDSWNRLKETLDTSQYFEIKYEVLLSDMETGLKSICGFLKIPYAVEMLDYPAHSTYGPPDSSLCYQWKSRYSKRELQLVEGKLRNYILENEYELSGNEPILPDYFELCRLKLENKFYQIAYQRKKYGTFLYLAMLISRRVKSGWLIDICQKKKNEIDVANLK